MQWEHVADAAALERACFSDPWTQAMIAEEIENGLGVFMSALREGQLVGYAGMQVILDEGYIANVAVAEPVRRQGVGRALLAALIRAARERELAFLTLEVRRSNAPAIALYESFGFHPVGLRPGYYHNPREDALLTVSYTHLTLPTT